MRPGEQLPAPENAPDEGYEPSDFSGPLEWYWHFSQRGDFQTDSEQLRVIDQLQRLFDELEDYRQYRQGRINRLVTNLGAGRKPERVPIFPLSTVLYPGALLPLRIFEARYMDMAKECLKTGGPFGICLIREGAEVGTPAVPEPVGCLARIAEADMEELASSR